MDNNGLTPYQLAQLREALDQGGLAGGGKLAGGLVDAWEYAGYPKAFFFLEKITDWFIAHSPSRDKNKLYLVEWYTIPENLYRAWWLSKNEKFKNAAERFEYMAFWENFLKEKFHFST